jgi:hypothetical protein
VPGSGAGREIFDLRNESTLALPNPTHTPGVAPAVLAQKFGGTAAAGEAICVGLFPYTSLSSGLPLTDQSGPAHEIACGREGWVSGFAVRSAMGITIASPSLTANVGTGLPEVVWSVLASTSGKKIAIDGIRFSLTVLAGNTDTVRGEISQRFFDETNIDPPSEESVGFVAFELGANDGRASYPTRLRMLPTATTVRARWAVTVGGGGTLSYTIQASNVGYKLPYGEPLYTPRLGRRAVGLHAGRERERRRREAGLDVEDDLEHAGRVGGRAHGHVAPQHVGVGAHDGAHLPGLAGHVGGGKLTFRLDPRAEARQVTERGELCLRERVEAGLERRMPVEKRQAAVGGGHHGQGDVGGRVARRGARHGGALGADHARRLDRNGRVVGEVERGRGRDRIRRQGAKARQDNEAHEARTVGLPRAPLDLDPNDGGRARARHRPTVGVERVVRVDRVDRANVGRKGHVDRFLTT